MPGAVDVVIVGAGPIGGALAFQLAQSDVAPSLALVDPTGHIAAGKALDIAQASPVQGFSTRVSGASDVFIAAGAPIVVLADTTTGEEWGVDDAFALLRRVVRAGHTSSPSVVVCAGATHASLVERAVREVGLSRPRVFGTAPEALAASVRAIAALEARRSPSEVGLTALGTPPDRVVIPWTQVTIGGFAATEVLDEPTRRRIAARVPHLWPPGPLALAAAAAQAVLGLRGVSRRGLSAFVAPDDHQGRNERTTAVPVVLNSSGIARIEVPPLSGLDRVAFDNAVRL
jgi:malate dehydrogenase